MMVMMLFTVLNFKIFCDEGADATDYVTVNRLYFDSGKEL